MSIGLALDSAIEIDETSEERAWSCEATQPYRLTVLFGFPYPRVMEIEFLGETPPIDVGLEVQINWLRYGRLAPRPGSDVIFTAES